jgi:hypothetical protein
MQAGKALSTPAAAVRFDVSNHPAKISLVEGIKGKSGWLVLQRLAIESFEREEYLLFSAFDDGGQALDQETCEKLFNCDGAVGESLTVPSDVEERLIAETDRHSMATVSKSLERNSRHFSEAREQLEKWADDMVLAAERELRDTKEQIKVLNRQCRQAATMQEQHGLQDKIRKMETKKRRLRQRIFDVEDDITTKRDKLIDELEKRMQQRTAQENLFSIRWTVA